MSFVDQEAIGPVLRSAAFSEQRRRKAVESVINRGKDPEKSSVVDVARAEASAWREALVLVLTAKQCSRYPGVGVRGATHPQAVSLIEKYLAIPNSPHEDRQAGFAEVDAMLTEITTDEHAEQFLEEARRQRVLAGEESPSDSDHEWIDEMAEQAHQEAVRLERLRSEARP